jgi:hypothetical protein
MAEAHTEVYISAPKTCDLCSEAGLTTQAEYDAKTTMGPWANLCQEHFDDYGVGLGLGRGQKLIVGTKPKPATRSVEAEVADILGVSEDEVEW